jgi:hypothetical protein
MHKVGYGSIMASLGLTVMVILPHAAWSGSARPRPPIYSDAEPFCAGCHASVRESHHPELQATASTNEVYTTQHYKVLEKGVGGLRPVDPEQRKQLLEAVAVHADVDGNELPSNGMPYNGLPIQGLILNGLPFNGLPFNGVPWNGTPLQGLPMNGIPMEGTFFNGLAPHEGSLPTVQSERLPWSTLSQRALGASTP